MNKLKIYRIKLFLIPFITLLLTIVLIGCRKVNFSQIFEAFQIKFNNDGDSVDHVTGNFTLSNNLLNDNFTVTYEVRDADGKQNKNVSYNALKKEFILLNKPDTNRYIFVHGKISYELNSYESLIFQLRLVKKELSDVTYSVNLGETSLINCLTPDIDLRAVPENTTLKFEINLPDNHVIEVFNINKINKLDIINNNKFEIIVTENINISLTTKKNGTTPEPTYYRVELLDNNEYIKIADSNINLEKILKDTNIEFIIELPSDKRITELIINDEDKIHLIGSNKHFVIKVEKDTNISLILEDLAPSPDPNAYYKVELLDNSEYLQLVDSSINLNKVLENTDVEFIINVPTNYKVKELLINNQNKNDLLDSNNHFIILITNNTTISLILEDISSTPDTYYKVELLDNSEYLQLVDSSINLNKVLENTDVEFIINVPTNYKVKELLINNHARNDLLDTNNRFTIKVDSNIKISLVLENTTPSPTPSPSPSVLIKKGDFNNYYDELVGLENDDPNTIINKLEKRLKKGYIRKTYGNSKIMGKYDECIDKKGHCWSIYDNVKYEGLNWPTGGIPWNREHVWCCAWLGNSRPDEGHKGPASDYHNLRVCTNTVNSERNNRFFADQDQKQDTGAVSLKYKNSGDKSPWFPGDLFKGDVARILLYMAIRWRNDYIKTKNGNIEVHIKLICQPITHPGIIDDVKTAYNPKYASIGDLTTLLKWHYEDPIDEFEKARNSRIFSYQKNRNPFVDYEHLFLPVWTQFMLNENKSMTEINQIIKSVKPNTTSMLSLDFNQMINRVARI